MPTLRPLATELDADALAAGCRQGEPERDAMLEVLGVLEAPLDELVTTPVTLRIAAAAAAEGRAFVHHELRRPLSVTLQMLPEVDAGALEVGWSGGILTAPKYVSSHLEAPLPTYDPNHRAKWRAHELLHRLARFLWRPDLTRFEAYVGARLAELLPVVHWYGLDEVGRGKCPEHRGVVLRRELCDACEAAAGPYWEVEPDDAVARSHAAAALAHLDDELAACARELETGRLCATPRIGLDAASDAVGYLRGHWNRITAWSFGAWMELFAPAHFDRGADMRAHVRGLATRLLTGAITVDADTARAERARRYAEDLGYRILVALEDMDDDAEATVRPALERLADGEPDAGDELEERFAHAVAGGWLWRPVPAASVELVRDGLRSALPRSLTPALEERIEAFVGSAAFRGQGEVFVRFAAFVDDPAVQLEAWLRRRPTLDLEAERFGVLPDDHADGTLRLNTTFRLGRFPPDAIHTVLDWEAGGPLDLAAVHFGGEPRAFEVTPEVEGVLEGVLRGAWAGDPQTRETLLQAGALVWLPRPR